MCGIGGMMTRDGRAPDPAILDRLTAALRHRGPDGTGRHVRDDVGLVHARLAIIDLKTGDQPLFGPRRCALVANAEIYNFVELRQRLGNVGFMTKSDCEPILHLYESHGVECARELRGMYGFGLHDPEKRCLIVSRDPFGIKQLYYVETPAGFAFASEPQALIAAGLVTPDPVPRAVGELLQLQFTTGPDTIFRGIRRVLPGETLVVQGGRVVSRTVLPALPKGGAVDIGEAEAMQRLDRVLMDSVTVHERSDVPYGLFLSSGIDSTTILACMARLDGHSVQAYTASFPSTSVHDEYAEAHRLAAALGARHIKVEVTADYFWSQLPRIVAAIDDPTADYAIVPTFLLAQEAAKDVKVVLCGEGGDEMFAGYSRYRRQSRPWWLGGRSRRRRGPFSNAGVFIEEPRDWRDGIAAAEKAVTLPGRSRLQVAQALDCADYLPHGLLVKLDRCLMAHGLEGRTPLLDPVIAEFAYRLPRGLKLRHRRGKYLLRRWLERQVPLSQPFARKKGFTAPVADWIRAKGERLGPLVAADPAIAALGVPERVKALFAGQQKAQLEAAWRLLFYALWHRRHVRGLAPDAGVFDCLAERG